MPMKTVHCRICGHAIRDSTFEKRMAKLRRHRKKKHPKAHRESVEKMLETKGVKKTGKKKKKGRKSRKKTYKKKSTAKKAKRKGESLYKVKGGWRISRK